MPTTTRSRRPQTRRTQINTPTARFSRGGRTPTRSARPSFPRRRQPQKKTGLAAMLGGLTGSGRGKKAGGMALLTAAAGFAVSNRDKLGSLLNRNKEPEAAPVPPPTTPPTERTAL